MVTNLCRPAEWVVAFYNGRGTAEQWIKAGKAAVYLADHEGGPGPALQPGFPGAPRRRVSPVEEGSIQRVVD